MRKELLAFELGYRVDVKGVVRNPKGTVLRANSSGNSRYPKINFKHAGRKYYVSMHRLAAYCFYGDRLFSEGILVRHLNGDKSDLRNENIVLGTQVDNMADIPECKLNEMARKKRDYALRNSIIPPRNFKIADNEIPSVITMIDSGLSYREIAKHYGVHHSTIYYINRTRRNNIGENRGIE